jgi:hypothetical protein
MTNNNCDHYHVELNLSNFSVDSETIYDVIKKRDMTTVIERYIIHKALFEFAEIYKEIKLYFNISFKLSRETLEDPTFKEYLVEQLAFFKIPKTAISIRYDDMVSDKVLNTLKDLSVNQIFLATANVDLIKQIPIIYFYYKMGKTVNQAENDFILLLKHYCDSKNIRFVIDNVNTLGLVSHYAPHGFNLYSGNVYSAKLTSKDIIKAFLA